MFPHADGVAPSPFISYDENGDNRRFEFLCKHRRPLGKGKDAVHKEYRHPYLVSILIGKEAQDVVFLHGTGGCNHFIAAGTGEVDMLPCHGTVAVDHFHEGIIGLFLSDGRCIITVKGKAGAQPFPVSHVGCKAYDTSALCIGSFQVFRMVDFHIIVNVILLPAQAGHVHHFHGRHAYIFIDLLQKSFRFRTGNAKSDHNLPDSPFLLFCYAVHNAGAQKAPDGQDMIIGHGAEKAADSLQYPVTYIE